MTIPDVHLAGEAVAAFVDGELSSVAHARAVAHLDVCAECRGGVRAQKEAAALLVAEPVPELPAALLARLREIPMTAELGGEDVILAVQGDEFVWGTTSSVRTNSVETSQSQGRSRGGRGPTPGGPGGPVAPAGRGETTGTHRNTGTTRPDSGQRRSARPSVTRRPLDHRPSSYSSSRATAHPQRMRRALVGAMAGLAFGVFVVTVPTTAAGHGAPDRDLIQGVNGGGIVDPPVSEVSTTGDDGVTGVRQWRDPGDFGDEFGSFDPVESPPFDSYPMDTTPYGADPFEVVSSSRQSTNGVFGQASRLGRSRGGPALVGDLPVVMGNGARQHAVARSMRMR